jgi:hypothetical protein
VQKRVKPEVATAKVMNKAYSNYRQLYPALKPIFAT